MNEGNPSWYCDCLRMIIIVERVSFFFYAVKGQRYVKGLSSRSLLRMDILNNYYRSKYPFLVYAYDVVFLRKLVRLTLRFLRIIPFPSLNRCLHPNKKHLFIMVILDQQIFLLKVMNIIQFYLKKM